MEFTEFVNLLKPIIGGAENTHSFVKTLFDVVVTEEGKPFLEDVKAPTYKAYFNGKTKITKMAQRISPYLEPEEFVIYLDAFSDATAQQIIDTFSPYIDGLNASNMPEKMAYFFCDIICTAATTEKKKGTPKSAKNTDDKTPHDILEEKIIASGQAVANAWGMAISNLVSSNAEAIEIPEKCPSEEYPYSSEDKALLQEFTSDYDEIMLALIGENYGAYVLNMPLRIRKGQRPKYRMIHATNHRDGCLLMVDNICNRWQALQDIQTCGQLTLWEENCENQIVDDEDIEKMR